LPCLRLRKPAAESARKPATKPANPDSEVGRLKATIVDLRRGLKHFQKRKDGKIGSRSYTVIRSRMHPDRVSDPEKKAVFGELEKAVVDKDQLLAYESGKKPEEGKTSVRSPPKGLAARPSEGRWRVPSPRP